MLVPDLTFTRKVHARNGWNWDGMGEIVKKAIKVDLRTEGLGITRELAADTAWGCGGEYQQDRMFPRAIIQNTGFQPLKSLTILCPSKNVAKKVSAAHL